MDVGVVTQLDFKKLYLSLTNNRAKMDDLSPI